MGGFSLWHILIFAVLVLLLFGGNRFSAMMGDVAKGLKSFKQGMTDELKKDQAERVVVALLRSLEMLERDSINTSNGHPEGEELKERLVEIVGDTMGTRIFETGRANLISAVLEKDIPI